MRVTSDKLTESEPRQQENRRIVEIQEKKYGDMFAFKSFCGNDVKSSGFMSQQYQFWHPALVAML